MKPPSHRRIPDTTVFGVRAQQDWLDLSLWEQMLDDHPEIRTVIEIGTFLGGLSSFLATQAQARGIEFYTWDIKRWPQLDERPYVAKLLDGKSMIGDALADPRLIELLDDPDNHPLLLFCDGGDKPAEFAKFAPLLQPGDIIGCHDWNQEIGQEDVDPFMDRLRPANLKAHATSDSLTRFFRVLDYRGWGKMAIGVRISKYPEPRFFMAWSELLTKGLRKGDAVLLPALHMPAHWAANALARAFLETDQDTLLMLDDDMDFGSDCLSKLRDNEANWQYDMIGALYTHRAWPPKPVLLTEMEQPGGYASRRGELFGTKVDWEKGNIVDVQAMGLGFTMIRRHVLEEMLVPGVPMDHQFFFSYGPGYESDDVPFCREARQLGFRLGVDTSVEIGHVAALAMTPDNWRDAKEQLHSPNGHTSNNGHTEAVDEVEFLATDLLPILEGYRGEHEAQASHIIETIRRHST